MTRLLRADALPISLWPNGAGRKADLLAGDGWLLSFAFLDADAPFSAMPGIDRTITLVDGPGFTLELPAGPATVDAPAAPFRFDGGAAPFCRVAGPSRVLNAMTRRDTFAHAVTIHDRSGPLDDAGTVATLVVALADGVRVGDAALRRFDAVALDGPAALVLPPGARAAMLSVSHVR